MKVTSLSVLILLGSLAVAAPVTYWVATGDGTPAEFAKQVDTAFNAWKAVPATTLKLEKNKDSSLQFVWNIAAEDVPINPDAITRTIQTASEGGKTSSTLVNVNPDQSENLESGLLVEAGLRLGVTLEPSIEGKRGVGEVEATALRSKYGQTGDLNGDQKVNLDDLATNYGKKGLPSVNLNGDFNGDGIVDDSDLEIMKTTYSFEIAAEKSLTPENPTAPTTPTKPETPTAPTTPTDPNTPPTPTTPTEPVTPPITNPVTPPPTDPSTPPTDPATPPSSP